jgi:hypothetical protein
VIRGNSKIRSSEQPEDAGFGATRSLIERRYWRVRIRGNPEIHHRDRRRMRDSRKLGDPSPAQLEDARTGATRGFIGKLETGRCMVRVTCEFINIETPGTPVSGVFVCGRLFSDDTHEG